MPPRDPYVPVPTAQPRQVRGEVATEPIHVDFPLVRPSGAVGEALGRLGQEGFGTLSRATQNVANAFDSYGKSLEHVGDQIWERAKGLQDVENETKASNAIVEYEHYVDEKREELRLKQGANATSVSLKMFNDDLEAKRQELRAKLPKIVQRRFDPTSISFAGKAGTFAAGHIAQQTKAAAVGAASAEVDMAVKQMGNAGNQKDFMDGYDRAHAQIYDKIGPGKGLSSSEMKVLLQEKAQAGLLANVTRISGTDPPTAWKMFYENKDKIIDPVVEQKARNTIQMNEVNWAARGSTDRATTDLWDDKAPGAPTKTEAERIKEAKEGALSVLSEDVKNNPTMMSALNETIERRVESAVSRQETATRNYRRHAVDTLTAQMRDPDGNLKDTIEQVWASSPESKAMYDSLPLTGEHSQKSVNDALWTMHQRGERVDPLVSRSTRKLIEGMAQHSDDSRMKLMDMNVYDPKLKLNLSDRDALDKVKKDLKAKPGGDPRVNRDWGWLEQAFPRQLQALGLLGVKKDDENLIKAKGDLWAALQAYEETHKGVVPDYKALIGEIGPQLLRGKTWEWQLGVGPYGFPRVIKPGEEPGFKQEVPENRAEAIKQEYRQRMGFDPTDDQIFRAYRQGVWEELYQGGGPSKPAKPTVAKKTTE